MAKTPEDATPEDQALVRELKERHSKRRWLYERTWWGNLLFLLGLQWVVWDANAKRYRQRKLSPSVPTPVTNLFRSTLDTVKSAIAQHDPRFLGTPTRDDPKAIAAAGMADTQLAVILNEGKFRRRRARMLDWLTVTGNAFMEVSWDDSIETGEDVIPYEQCQSCLTESSPDAINRDDPKCPACGSGMLAEMSDKGVTVPKGSVRFDTRSPFEVYMDASVEDLEDQPHVLFVHTFAKEQVAMQWGVDVDEDAAAMTTGGAFFRESVSSIATGGSSLSTTAGGGDMKSRVTVVRAFIKSHKDYPKGAYIAMTAAGKLLEKKTPYPWQQRGTGKKFFPFEHFRFGTTGGRAWGYTPADDLAPKQYQLNKAESLLTLILTRMANPVWLIPSNTNPTRITGDIGIQIEYTPVGSAAPSRIAGAEAPQSLVKYIADIRQSFDELSGAFAAVRGRATGTRTPVGTTQMMADRGFGRWATVFDALEEGYENLAKKSLEIWRQNANSPRVRAVKNAVGGWTFQEFLASDWDDGVDIQVEAGSARPKTQQEKLQTYMGLIQAGLLDVTDHAQRVKILEDTGMVNMLPGVEEDTKQAYKENAEFMQWAKQVTAAVSSPAGIGDPNVQAQVGSMLNQPPIMANPLVDDHAVHFLTHRRLALTDEFKALPTVAQNVLMTHMMQHKMDLGQSQITAAPPPIAGVNKPVQVSSGEKGGVPITSQGA